MYDDDPILQERRTHPFPDGSEEEESIKYEEVGRKNRRPSFLRNVIGESLRGAAIGLARPSTGNAAQDIGQTLLAVGEDRQARQDRAESKAERMFRMRRQQQQDEESSQLHAAQIENYKAQAEQRRAQTQKKGFADTFDPVYNRAIELGKTPEEAWAAAMGVVTKNPFAFIKRDPRSEQAQRAEMLAMLRREEITEQDYQDFEQRMVKVKADQAAAEAFARGRGGAPWTPGRFRQTKTDRGYVETRERILPDPITGEPTLQEESKMLTMPDTGEVAKPYVPPRTPRQPPRPLAPIPKVGSDGKLYFIDPNTRKNLGPVEGFTPKPPGKQSEFDSLMERVGALAAAEDAKTAGASGSTAPAQYKFTREYQGAKYGRNSASEPWKKIQ